MNNTIKLGLGMGISSIILFYIFTYKFQSHCVELTNKLNEKNFPRISTWEKNLDIYSISIGKFYSPNPKKQHCILLIGGYKDIPHIWNELTKYLERDGFDYWAPRTCGCGRSFYQSVEWKDWVLTYMEALKVLETQYETVDIISFSTGTVIALYLTQFNYKCKISNLFLCAPFLINGDKSLITKIFFSSNIISKTINWIYSNTLRFHTKSKSKFLGYRNTHNEYYSINDYYEIFGDIITETTLLEFIKFRPKTINVHNLVILNPNDDDIIGDIEKQRDIVCNIFSKFVPIITIPSYLNEPNYLNYPDKCGHVMFKEKPEIVENIYQNIRKYIFT